MGERSSRRRAASAPWQAPYPRLGEQHGGRLAPDAAGARRRARLDALRVDVGMSKAELAPRIGRDASSIRRLFTASHARPELSLVAAIADALGAEVRVVPRTGAARRSAGDRAGERRHSAAA